MHWYCVTYPIPIYTVVCAKNILKLFSTLGEYYIGVSFSSFVGVKVFQKYTELVLKYHIYIYIYIYIIFDELK